MCGGGGGNPLKCRLTLSPIKALLKQAQLAYRCAQWALLETLLCSPKNYTIKTFKKSLGSSGRLDAEYYQEKYARNEALIKAHSYAKLQDLVEIKKSLEPGSSAYKDKGVPFVRVSNLSPFGLRASEVFLTPSLDLKPFYPRKNEVLLSKDGSIGVAYCVPQDLEVVPSGAILRLAIKDKTKINPQYLALCLNSQTTQLQAQRDSIGSVIAHWNMEQISNLLIPLLDPQIQERIAKKLTQSFKLKEQSQALLTRAKQEVEGRLGVEHTQL